MNKLKEEIKKESRKRRLSQLERYWLCVFNFESNYIAAIMILVSSTLIAMKEKL